jgi:hypothetical protein
MGTIDFHNMISVSRAGAVISAKHISSTPNCESSSTVKLQIGRAAALELVWRSWSPPKHALKLQISNATQHESCVPQQNTQLLH